MEGAPKRVPRMIRQNWRERARGDDAPDRNRLITVQDLTPHAIALLHTYRISRQNSMSLNEAVAAEKTGLSG